VSPIKTPIRVMVVDDDTTTVELLERQLRDSGYVVRSAAGGADALRLMVEWKPQIVVLDWIMPGMDGTDVCRQIRAIAGNQYTYVIMVTVHVEKHRVVEAFDAGVDDFLSKPLDRGELLARLHAATRTIRLHKEVSRREQLARRMGARIERLNQQVKMLVMTDELTGLLNRREANRRLAHTWALAERYGHPVSCAMLDIDDFKCFNNQNGHAAGDAVLRAVAEAMQGTLRATDGVCRYAGDEFLLFFPHQGLEESAVMAERVRRDVGLIRLPQVLAPITLSVGVASRREGMLTYHDLIDSADHALYHAKRMGKNQLWAEGLRPTQLSA
jgi:two-component system cell cycle response regulator